MTTMDFQRGVLPISHRGYVLETGRNRFEGTGQALIASEAVHRLYMGAGGH
jgi:neutral amino acid transport system ATP-binding protein